MYFPSSSGVIDFVWKSVTYIGHLREGKVGLSLKYHGEEEIITFLNILYVPVIMLGVVKYNSFPDSWNNCDTSVIIDSSNGFGNVCMGK